MLKPICPDPDVGRRPRGVPRSVLVALLLPVLALAPGCSAHLEKEGLGGDSTTPSPARPAADPVPTSGMPAGDAGAPEVEPELSPAPPDDSAGPMGPTAEAPQSAGVPRCGPPPYRPVRLSARDLMAPISQLIGVGVSVRLKHCPERTIALGPDGGTVLVTAGASTWIRFDADGYLPWIEGEIAVPEQGPPLSFQATLLPAGLAQTLVPSFKPDLALVYVEIRKGRSEAAAPCHSPAGVRLAVKDHPGAVVLYRDKGATAEYNRMNLTATDEGIALVSNLPSADAVELVAEKEGCSYQLAYGDANSPALLPIVRTPLVPGAITHQVINPQR